MDRRTSVRELKKCFENKNNNAEENSQPDKTNKYKPKDEIIDVKPKEETIEYRPKNETIDVGTNFPEKRISSKNNYYLSNLSYERPTLERLNSLNIEKVVAKIYDNVEHLQRCSLDSTLVTKEIKVKELPSPEIVTIISRNNSEATPEKFKDYLEQNNKPKDELNTKQVTFIEEQKSEQIDEEASTNLITVTELSSPFWANNEDVQSLKEDEPMNKYATTINNNVYSSKDGSPKTNSLKNELLLEELPLVIEPEIKRKPKPQRNKSIKLSTKKQIKKPIFNLEDDGTVPKFVQFCVDQLNKHNLIETLGIYRSSPSYTIVMNLLSDLEKGRFKYEDLDESTILASALKSYFKYLQKPLLNVFQDYHLANGSDVEFCKEHIKEYLNKMQSIEKQTLIFLLIHLADVASKSTENLMDVQNIASVWSPCLFPTLNINSNDLFIYTNFQISLLEFLIKEQNSLFDAKDVGTNRGIMPIANPVPQTKENKKKLCCSIL